MHRILWHILTGEEVEDLGLKLKGPSSKRFSYSGSIIHTCQVICFKKSKNKKIFYHNFLTQSSW